MSDASNEELMAYYLAELSYLRDQGASFAARYPRIAGRLDMGGDESPDPHVERLIESFAFLTGRLQRNLDQQFPVITSSLLGILYPHYVNPTPSMTVARLLVDLDQGKSLAGRRIERGTPMVAHAADGISARFRSCYDVTLWPLEVTYAGIESTAGYRFLANRKDVTSVIRIRIESKEALLEELEVDSLRFYINLELGAATDLHQILFARLADVRLSLGDEGTPASLGLSALRAVGFEPDEAVLPSPDHSHPGYRLLQEYFCFPRKYLFFDIEGLGGRLEGESFDLIFLVTEDGPRDIPIDEATFQLGCTPIINLFPKTTEPIRLDHKKSEYRLVPDMRRERSTEIHSILSVSSVSDADSRAEDLQPYYSFDHTADRKGRRSYWTARRFASTRADLPGTEMMISFVDVDFRPELPPDQTVYAHTLCTNRRLAEQLLPQTHLQLEQTPGLRGAVVLHSPTPQRDPPTGGDTQWRLISHLSLNYLSLGSGPEHLTAFKEILRLYSVFGETRMQRQIEGVEAMETEPAVHRMHVDAWRGFVRGVKVRIVLDEQQFAGMNAFLFGSVLRYFFGLYASVNSFTQLELVAAHRPQEVWKRWPPLAGSQEIL